MNIVVASHHKTGIHFHRQVAPCDNLKEHYNCTVSLINVENLYMALKQYRERNYKVDIILFSAMIPFEDLEHHISNFKNVYGCKIVLDLDDYWVREKEIQYGSNNDNFYQQMTKRSIKVADLITTTTNRLADKIRKVNKNVSILPNGIDVDKYDCWTPKKREGELMFGYLGSSRHQRDLKMIDYNFEANNKNCSVVMPESKEDIKEQKFEGYKEILGATHTLPLQPLETYGALYNDIDVSLVPLKPTKFNSMKSELKLIEAGFKKRAVIVSDTPPYSDYRDLTQHCITIPPRGSWKEAIESMTKEKAIEMGEALHKAVVDKYNLTEINKKRYDVYSKVLR